MSTKRKKTKPSPKLLFPEELKALLEPEEIRTLRRRINRRLGACGVCGKKLGKDRDLAMVVAAHNVTDLHSLAGEWHVMITHRACQKESLLDSPMKLPQTTYTTTLMALPVEPSEGLPRQVPVLMINPSVDHLIIRKERDGSAVDGTMHLLETSHGFSRMTTGAPPPAETDLKAYVRDADVTVALNKAGLSWSHEQPQANAAHIEDLAHNLKALLGGWDDNLLVLVSPKFKSWEPNHILEHLPQMLRNGDVLAAPAAVEYRESNAQLAAKAFAAATGMSANE